MSTEPTKDPRAEEAIRRWDDLRALRTPHERDWEDLARLVRPQRSGFTSGDPSQPRTDKPLSSAPILAQVYFSSGLYGTLTNPANRWMGVEVTDPDLAAWQPMREWQDTVASRILMSFGPDTSSFYDSTLQVFGDIATFGNAANYDETAFADRRILDVTVNLAQIVVAIDGFGRVVEVVRRFSLTGRQAVDMFRREIVKLPAKVREYAEKGSQDQVTFYHHVLPNMDWRRGMLGPRGKRWLSRYACETGCAIVRESGYQEMPFHFPRWEVDTGQMYGRGPGMNALPDARVLNQMDAANLRAGQWAADMPLLAPDRDAWPLNGVVRPGEVVYGGMNIRGDQLIRPLDKSGGTNLTLEMAQDRVERIKDAFHWTLMQLAGRTGMTATEVMEIAEERLRLMAPNMGRVQGEYLAPKIARRFYLLWRAGQLPPPPREAAREDVGLAVKYLSAAAMAQKSAEGAAIIRLVQDVAPLIEVKPRIADRLDEDALIEALQEARGAPARLIRSREDADKLSAQRQQQAMAAQALEAAKPVAGAVKDLAMAQAAGSA